MEGQELRDGKERVRINLIEPLVKGGMVRKRGQKVEEHDKFLASLEARLAYMAEDRLQALAEVSSDMRAGRKRTSGPLKCRS